VRSPSPRLLANSVTVRVATYANVAGVRTPSYTDTVYAASVQPGAGSDGDAHLQELGDTAYRVYLTSDPGAKAGDIVVWGARTLSVIAVANDRAGRGACFRLDCAEVR